VNNLILQKEEIDVNELFNKRLLKIQFYMNYDPLKLDFVTSKILIEENYGL